MSGAMNRHCIPRLTMSIALTGNFSGGRSGNDYVDAIQGLARTRIALSANAPVLTRKKLTRRSVERFVAVF